MKSEVTRALALLAGGLTLTLAQPSLTFSQTLEPLPEGNTGIASRYPGDVGIGQDTAVVFADDFESASRVSDLRRKWDVLINQAHLSIATGAGQSHGGDKSLLMTIPKRNTGLSIQVAKLLSPTRDKLFLRYYLKFNADYSVPNGSGHNGASMYAKYYVDGQATPGVAANGRNKFLVSFENENTVGEPPGHMNVYIYWPEQGDRWGDHFFPSGRVLPFSSTRSGAATFGTQFVSRQDYSPDRGRWYCYEFMVQANTPGQRDGRIGLWLDGKLIADFPNIRLRDVADLKIDRIGLSFYLASNTERVNRKWSDDVVLATSYIGPKAPLKPRIERIMCLGDEVEVEFLARAGQTYSLLAKDSLAQPSWSPLAHIPAQAATGPYIFRDTKPARASRYYQVVTP